MLRVVNVRFYRAGRGAERRSQRLIKIFDVVDVGCFNALVHCLVRRNGYAYVVADHT
jgi:hypothetical protein